MNNILEYLEQTEERCPDKIAVADREKKYSFQELRSRVKRTAAMLIKEVGGGNQAVAVIADRSAGTVVSMLGIAASGNYYVVLDPEAPPEKIKSILEDSEAVAVVGRNENLKIALGCRFTGKFLSSENLPHEEYSPDYSNTKADTPLYMVYTSGSTGRPKGILKSHSAYISFIDSFQEQFGIGSDNVIGNQTPFFFDASAKDLYLMLKTGATLEILPSELFMFPVNLIQYMNERKVSYISWVPSALSIVTQLRAFKVVLPKYLKYVFFVGEVFPMKQLNKWRRALPDLKYTNLYGSSEIAGVCCYYEVSGDFSDDSVLPIGKALPNSEVFLVKDGAVIDSENEVGEICISGKSLALCYFHDDDRTKSSFFTARTPSGKNARCFLTGDLAFYDSDKNLVFVSRKDFQIKHMGHRIELGEIESIANSMPGIQRACCLYNSERKRIVLFCQFPDGEDRDSDEVFSMLKGHLSDYMMPNRIVIVDKLPLNANGKIDRQKLKEVL